MLSPTRMMDRMAGVSHIIRIVLFSDYVKLDIDRKEVALSLLIIAMAESAKTSVIEQYYPNNGILYANDITAYGIQHKWLDRMKSGNIKRILIPDLINPVNRKKETVDTLITFLNAYISWEGVRTIMTYAMQIELDEPVRGSFISTITPQDFQRMVKNLAAVGFLSRLLYVTYDYSPTTVNDIMEDIVHRNDKWSKIGLNFPTSPVAVYLSEEQASKLIPISRTIGKRVGAYGFRALRSLMTMCRANALSEGRDIVTDDDVWQVIELCTKYVKLPKGIELPTSEKITDNLE